MPILVAAVALFVLILILKAVRVVPQAENWILERFGKFADIMKPGLNMINPLFSRVAKKVDVREGVLDLPEQEIITADNAGILVDGVVFFKIMDPYKSYYGIQNLSWAISNLAQTTLRSLMGQLTLDESLSSRDQVNSKLLLILDEATDSWGTKITRVEIRNIQPKQQIAEAMEKQMRAERERRATVLQAEGEKTAQILRAEGEKNARILESEGRKEASFRDAEAREKLAQAEANALKMVAESLKGADPTVYLLGQQYVKSLLELGQSPNAKFVVIPADIMNSVKGLLSGFNAGK
ncbi:MAG TPA: paraslipin [Spirochaetia bacterium]|nr:MAG: hypothetical protein A2Y41_02965 [Spirochaetes bacterium GWB1_36_13]HCL56021.1 paraslipin [Spirochaetia bacterium]